jgi:hypothetical protein
VAIPLATTTISIRRPGGGGSGDDYDPPVAATTVGAGVRAVIRSPGGSEVVTNGDRETVTWALDADPCDLTYADVVVDDATGDRYDVLWARERAGPGGALAHVVAALRQTRGGL